MTPDPDTQLKINIRPQGDGTWIASSPTKPKLRVGDTTPEDALERFAREIRLGMGRGAKIESEITGVSAMIEIYAPENRSLEEFGIGEIPTVQTCGETHIHIDPGCMQAMHDAAATIREEYGDTEGGETPSDPIPTGIENTGRAVYGISLDRYTIELIRQGMDYIILPRTTSSIDPGEMVMVYETGAAGGRKAYVGEFIAGEKTRVERWDEETNQAWLDRLHMDEEKFDELFDTQFFRTALQISDYMDYPAPIAVPDDEKSPRGMNWLSPTYLAKMSREGF